MSRKPFQLNPAPVYDHYYAATQEPENEPERKTSAQTFGEWFHAEYLRLYGPVDPQEPESVARHRVAKSWAASAWTKAVLETMRHLSECER